MVLNAVPVEGEKRVRFATESAIFTPFSVLRQTPLRLIDGRDVRTMQDLKLLEMEDKSPWVKHVVEGWENVDDFAVSFESLARYPTVSATGSRRRLQTGDTCPMSPALDKPALMLSIYSRRSVLVCPSITQPGTHYTYTPVTRSLVGH